MKRALLIGINYRGQKGELRGCINDVNNVRQYIVQHGYDAGNMRVLTDDNQSAMPTKQNILDGFRWLMSGVRPGDSLFIHYSGHGGREKDRDGDEKDGYDECIYPVDFQQAGSILDDDMHRILVEGLPQGAKLTAIFDCCHSGTALDLPFAYRIGANGQATLFNKDELMKMALTAGKAYLRGDTKSAVKSLLGGAKSIAKGFLSSKNGGGEGGQGSVQDSSKAGGDVYLFSGCKDDQTSADAHIDGSATGAMSYALLQTLGRDPNPTYHDLLKNTRAILSGKYSQVPQLSVGKEIDLNARFAL